MEKSDVLFNLVGIKFGYKDEIVYFQFNLEVLRDKITVIMGPSGCGKSTLLGLMTAQLEPDEGTVFFDGDSLSKLSQRDLYSIRRRVGMMFQNNALLSDLTVFENVAFPVRENSKMTDSLIEFNSLVWKAKKDSGVSLAAPISGHKIPAELSSIENALVSMHKLE